VVGMRRDIIKKSDCLSSFEYEGSVSRFYSISERKEPFIFVITIDRGAGVNIVFTFKNIKDSQDIEVERYSDEIEKVKCLRLFFDGYTADLYDLTMRNAYTVDYNSAVRAMNKHIREENELNTLITSTVI
jgi:hypothetical protein